MTEVLQQFECVVVELTTDSVVLELHDLTKMSNPLEITEIDLDKFEKDLRDILKEGLAIHWTIGYDTKGTGQVVRASDFSLTLDQLQC